MARIPTSTQLASPNFGGGRAVRNIPNVEVPALDIPTPDLPERINTPTVNVQAPSIPNAVPVANDVNIPQVKMPDTLYTASEIDALGAPGRAWANLGRTISSEADRWLTIGVALEKEKAGIAETQGFAQIEKELADDKDYKTWVPRYQAAAEKVKADALSNFTMPNHAARFEREFAERAANETERIRKKAYAREADEGRAELKKIIETRQQQIENEWVSDVDRKKARQDVEEAIDKARDLGYIDAEDAVVRKKKFASDVALSTASTRAAKGDYEGVLTDLDGGKGLAKLRQADPQVQQGMVKAAEESGVPLNWLAELAVQRSNLDPGPDAEGRTGLFKMSDEEWARAFTAWDKRTGMAEKAGLNKLEPFQRDQVLQSLRNDPVVESRVAAEAMFDAQATIEDEIYNVRPITLKDILLYQNPTLGKERAIRLIKGTLVDPTLRVKELWDDKDIRALKLDPNDTLKQAYDFLTDEISDGSLPNVYTDLDQATRLALRNKIEAGAYKERSQSRLQKQLNQSNLARLTKSTLMEMENEGKASQQLTTKEFVDAYGPVEGPVKALDYARGLEEAQAKYDVIDDLPMMTEAEIATRYQQLDPGAYEDMDYASRERIRAAFKKKADAVQKLRRNDPAKAVDDHVEVLAVIDSFNELEAAQQPDGVLPDEGYAFKKQRMIAEARMAAQDKLGLETAPVTRDEAKQIMRRLTGANMDSRDALVETMNEVETIYGPETGKKVMATAIAYHIKNKKQADTANRLIDKVMRGDPLDFENIQRDIIGPQIEAMRDAESEAFLRDPDIVQRDDGEFYRRAADGSLKKVTRPSDAFIDMSGAGLMLNPRTLAPPQTFPKPPPAAIERLRAEPHLADKFAEKYGIETLIKIFKTFPPRLMTPVTKIP